MPVSNPRIGIARACAPGHGRTPHTRRTWREGWQGASYVRDLSRRHKGYPSGNHYFLKRKCKGVKRCQNSVRTGPDTRFTDEEKPWEKVNINIRRLVMICGKGNGKGKISKVARGCDEMTLHQLWFQQMISKFRRASTATVAVLFFVGYDRSIVPSCEMTLSMVENASVWRIRG